jgi:hypothetical protein
MIPTVFAPLANLKAPPFGAPNVRCKWHQNHETITVRLVLDGQPLIPDVPAIPHRLRRELTLELYDYRRYGQRGYEGEGFPHDWCTGQDIISYSIAEQGVWEGYETLTVLDVLDRGKRADLMLDLGAHIGWYSALADQFGVFTVEASAENNLLIGKNVTEQKYANPWVDTGPAWIDEDAPILPADAETIHLVKIDLEGAENHAVRMLSTLFAARKINYCLMEVSPIFADYYPDLVAWVADQGYRIYQIPGKGWERTPEYSDQPLETLRSYCEVPATGLREYVAGLRQENFMFVKRSCTIAP